MSKPQRPKIVRPSEEEDEEAIKAATERERRRAAQQAGRVSSVFAPRDTFGSGASASAGLRSSFGG